MICFNPISVVSDEEKTKKRAYSQFMKQQLLVRIFMINAAPPPENFDVLYGDIEAIAATEVYCREFAPDGVKVSVKDKARRIWKVFTTYTNKTVDRLFALVPALGSSENIVSYKASKVNALLSKEDYSCFHLTDCNGVSDNVWVVKQP